MFLFTTPSLKPTINKLQVFDQGYALKDEDFSTGSERTESKTKGVEQDQAWPVGECR